MQTRKASLDQEWEALTEAHERELSRAQESFQRFQSGEAVDPLALVGAYRSGKTQLIYHLFSRSWERGIPAFYIGDPGGMLERFVESDETDLNTWIENEIQRQLDAYEVGDLDEIRWFPNVDSETKQEKVAEYAKKIASEERPRTALFFDEVEQSYQAFLQAMDKDDDNPLRKINDELQDTIKVWSFGMISAFEFIGEADWGRMREIRIPPLDVTDVRELLAERRPDATELANAIWWLARGRTGIIIKLIDELPADPIANAVPWLRDLADASFKDTRLINNLWTELDRQDWDAAMSALLFQPGGLESWSIQGDKALTVDTCQTIVVNIIQDEYAFAETEDDRDAISILDRNIERVFQGLAVGEDQLFPQFGLSNSVDADAFLDLVNNMTVSFEPASEERRIAIDAIDEMQGSLETMWLQRASDAETIDGSVQTASPVRIRDAFPPIAVNPERVSSLSREELEEEMERGLELDTRTPENDRLSIKFCPTERAVRSELSELTNAYDITSPSILVVPEDEEVDIALSEPEKTYQRHRLLRIEQYQSNRFWSFVVNLFGRLRSEGFRDPYFIDDELKTKLIAELGEREVRNTIETLYDQLWQIASDEITAFAAEYEESYSLRNTNDLLWDEERLKGDRPFWSNGKFVESTIALSYLPVFGPDYESGRNYSSLHRHFETAISNDLVAGGKNGLSFTEYFDDMFTQSGYSSSVKTERKHYREGGEVAPAVRQVQSTLTALAQLNDVSSIVSKLDDPDVDVENGQVPVVGVSGLSHLGYSMFRALLVCGLTTGSDPVVDVPSRLQNVTKNLRREKDVVGGYIDEVETLDELLTSPDSLPDSIGTWVEIKTDRLEQFQTNLDQVVEGLEDLIEKCQADSSAAPVGYHYWFLAKEYQRDISDQIDDLDSDISRASVDQISDALSLFESVHQIASTSDAIEMHFDSREALLSQIEDYGNSIFDLQSELGATSLSIPEDREDLADLNKSVGDTKSHLTQLESDLREIEQQAKSIRSDFTKTKDALNGLLAEKEVSMNE